MSPEIVFFKYQNDLLPARKNFELEADIVRGNSEREVRLNNANVGKLSRRPTELTPRDHEINVELNFRDMIQIEFPCGQIHLSTTSRSSCFNETTICNLLWPGFMWILCLNIVWAWSSFHEIVAYPPTVFQSDITDMSTLLKKEIYDAVCFVDDSCRIRMS